MKKTPFDNCIILGVDPGTRTTGYGIIEQTNQTLLPIDYGCIRPPISYKLSDRYLIIYEAIEQLIDKHQPSVIAVEMQFVHKNIQSALKLGMAKGSVIIAAKRKKIPVFEYAPTVAKRAVVGTGRASKHQVQGMVQRILKLASPPQPDDAADALALAICHAHIAEHLRANHEI